MATSSPQEADACDPSLNNSIMLSKEDGGSACLLCLFVFFKLIQQEQSLAQELIIAKLSG